MDRTGLSFYRVERDVGMMGGLGAHEYMAPCPAGEDEVVLAHGYAANVEVARAEPQPVGCPRRSTPPRRCARRADDDREVAGASACPRARC